VPDVESDPSGEVPSPASGARLESLGGTALVWLQTPHGHGRPNAGVVVDDDGVTVIDTLLVPSQATALAGAIADADVGPVRRAVYTSSHAEYTGGSGVFRFAARYGSPQTSAAMDTPPNVAAFKRLHPEVAEEFDDLGTRPVSHTVDAAAWITSSVCLVPTGGQMAENLVAFVPSADTLYAGAMCCFGVTPNCFDGDPLRWADALGDLAELAGRVVPGLGRVGGPADIVALQAYLWACAEADGDVTRLTNGPWSTWADRHFDAVNVERAAMLAAGDPSVPPSMLRLVGLA
jgi:glyoxylase-like metal-dependent hydrolase (beta-lactamase superfamily II)